MPYAVFPLLLAMLTPFRADKVEIVQEDSASVVHLIGNVAIEQESTLITSAEAILNETAGYVRLFRDIVIKDKTGDIKAQQALYYFHDKKASLSGTVELRTDTETLSSDSLDYDGITKQVLMHRNVKIVDEKNDMTAYGARGWYDLGEDYGSLTGKPHLEVARARADSGAVPRPPMTVAASSFMLYARDNMFWGYDSVTAVIDSITVDCDTFAYDLSNESGTMVRPRVMEKTNELAGSHGSFKIRNKTIEYFSVRQGTARYTTREGSKNLVEGEQITVFFLNGEASRVVATGQPRGRLLLSPEKTGEDAGN
jgi:lipopolysaccharide export system protein LptA